MMHEMRFIYWKQVNLITKIYVICDSITNNQVGWHIFTAFDKVARN